MDAKATRLARLQAVADARWERLNANPTLNNDAAYMEAAQRLAEFAAK